MAQEDEWQLVKYITLIILMTFGIIIKILCLLNKDCEGSLFFCNLYFLNLFLF